MKKTFARFIQHSLSLTLLSAILIQCDDGGPEDLPPDDNKPPTIVSVTPESNSILRGDFITLSAEVNDTDGTVARVEFLINDAKVGESTSAPYEFNWTPSASDHYTFSVRAIDEKGAVALSVQHGITAVGYSCSETNECEAYTPKSIDNVVTAFYPSWKVSTMPVVTVPFSKLTHIIYSFALPVAGGELNTSDLDGNIDALVSAAHANGVKAYFSIGGAGGSEPFISIAKNERDRALFIDRVNCYMKAHCLDGVDIDWEHWTGGANIVKEESNGLVKLLEDLRNELPGDAEISVDVYASNWFGKHYPDAVHQHVNYVHAMLYDLRGPWSEVGPQSNFEEVIDDGTGSHTIEKWGLMYWNGYRNWPVEKTVVGIPFYGRDFNLNDGEGVDYRVIAARVAAAERDINADTLENTFYDGPGTVARKAAYARDHGYAGVMFWELTGDTTDPETSLLEAIDQELND